MWKKYQDETRPSDILVNAVMEVRIANPTLEEQREHDHWWFMHRRAMLINNPIWLARRAPPMPQVEHDESTTASLVDVDSPHVSSVPSDYHGETKTQVEREEREAQEAEEAAKRKYEQISEEASQKYEKAKKEASKKAHKAKETSKAKGREFKENSDNPVVIGNMVVIGLGSAMLGFVTFCYMIRGIFADPDASYGAYQKYAMGELSWKLVGAWAGVIGLFATADYYVSS